MKAAVLAGSLSLLAGAAFGQGLSDPVGYYTKTLRGSATTFGDSSLGIGLFRPEFGSVTISGLDTGTGVATINETLTAGELDDPRAANPLGSPGDTSYYLLATSGTDAGAWYPIASNGANSLTLNLMGETPSIDGGKIIPFWDLESLFPLGAGLHPIVDVGFTGASRILVYDMNSVGQNGPAGGPGLTFGWVPASSFGAANEGFYEISGGISPGNQVNPVIFPTEHLIVRHAPGQPDTSLTVTGDVLVDSIRTSTSVLGLPGNTGGQDVNVSVPYPVPVALQDLNLAAPGGLPGFTNTTDPFGVGFQDRLLVYNDDVAGENKAYGGTGREFLYIDGVDPGTGPIFDWFDPTAGLNPADPQGATLIAANTGVRIRRVAGSTAQGSWTFVSPYTP